MLAPPFGPIDTAIAAQLAFSKKMFDEAGLPRQAAQQQLAPLEKIATQLKAVRANKHDGTPIGGVSVEFWQSWMDLADKAVESGRRSTKPLMALGGSYDWNVPPAEVEQWREALAASPAASRHKTTVLDCVTHVLNCISESNYRRIKPNDIGRTVHPPVVQAVASFLAKAMPAHD